MGNSIHQIIPIIFFEAVCGSEEKRDSLQSESRIIFSKAYNNIDILII